jgi:hypothetical protein
MAALPRPEVFVTEFHTEIRSRIAETRRNLTEATQARDDYLVELRLGELETLARIAAENDVTVEGVDEAFAAHGRATPAFGVQPIDLR